ncbi:MAG: glycoside hydrolase family 3 C-terminal domain-containing protein, partial [Muribaculaceae bacterium]|nr:glycoside hydrolase family 3 C-terminal domain-containing protein [Muribaculaceae bacterium]
MKIRLTIMAVAMIIPMMACGVTITDEHKQQAREIVAKMTLDEKISYLSGKTSFSLRPIERLGIPEIWLADGPQGIRNHCDHSTMYPSGILLASTWNRELARRYGASLGNDARARGVGILLGPGVNIYRAPVCGRNFEYMGEDPCLTAEMAAEYIAGVQSRGVIATIKHFAANNQEWSRHHASSDIDERTLHEIYFPAFRKAVEVAGVGAVMNSYNLVNGVHATENRWMNTDILRNTWGFDGILMSDWTSVYSTVNAANSGLDLEMPKGVYFTADKLREALATGRVSMSTIDDKVSHLLQTFIAFGLLERGCDRDSTLALDNSESRATALDVAREGVVLLKNDGGILPLRGRTAVMGSNAAIIPTGGGSGHVSPFSSVPVAAAMKSMRRNTVLLTDDVIYDDIAGSIFTDSTLSERGFRGEYFKNQRMEGVPDVVRVDSVVNFRWEYDRPMPGFPDDHFSVRWSACYRPEADGQLKLSIGGDDGYRLWINDSIVAGDWGNHAYSSREVEYTVKGGELYRLRIDYFDNISSANIEFSAKALNERLLRRELERADNVVFCTGFTGNTEGEGFDRSFALPEYQERFIGKIGAINPNLVVVLNAGGGVDTGRWIDSVKALVMAWYPGQEGGTAVAEILTGAISPSGRLPISIERRVEDNPSWGNYYSNTKVDREAAHVDYREGVFGGYRGYDRAGVEPRFPFGFGLSYSQFRYSGLEADILPDNRVKVSFSITNTGKCDAADVAQIYVGDTECSVPRPVK